MAAPFNCKYTGCGGSGSKYGFGVNRVTNIRLDRRRMGRLVRRKRARAVHKFGSGTNGQFSTGLGMSGSRGKGIGVTFSFSSVRPRVVPRMGYPMYNKRVGGASFNCKYMGFSPSSRGDYQFSVKAVTKGGLPIATMGRLLASNRASALHNFGSGANGGFSTYLGLRGARRKGAGVMFSFSDIRRGIVHSMGYPLYKNRVVTASFNCKYTGCGPNSRGDYQFSVKGVTRGSFARTRIQRLLGSNVARAVHKFGSGAKGGFSTHMTLTGSRGKGMAKLGFSFSGMRPGGIGSIGYPGYNKSVMITPFKFVYTGRGGSSGRDYDFVVKDVTDIQLGRTRIGRLLAGGGARMVAKFITGANVGFSTPLGLARRKRVTFSFPRGPGPRRAAIPYPGYNGVLVGAR